MTIEYFKVGGFVRDAILGVKSKDIDYAVQAPSYDAMRQDIVARGAKIFYEKPEFLTIRAKYNGEDVDFVLCRKEGAYSDARHPDKVEPGTIDDDLARRDFTMNAIAQREDGTYYDPFGGVADTKANIIRCVGNATERFSEDSLRLLRACRFEITKNLFMAKDVKECLQTPEIVDKIKSVSTERIMDEMNRCFAYNTFATLIFFDRYSYLRNTIFSRPGFSIQTTMKKV